LNQRYRDFHTIGNYPRITGERKSLDLSFQVGKLFTKLLEGETSSFNLQELNCGKLETCGSEPSYPTLDI
jgi:hypothetical protein